MAEYRAGTGTRVAPVPRDMPDQQAGAAEDPWDAADPDRQDQPKEPDAPATDIPDTDESST